VPFAWDLCAMSASVQDTMRSINEACKAKGGKYAAYSCKVVSWDDVSRGTVGGSLSCWGSNITDTYLKSKDGAQLFTVRSDNWNEKLGRVSSNEVAVLAGNHQCGGGPLAPTTLKHFLAGLGHHGGYAGLGVDADLGDNALDLQCSIRFQTTFLPVSGERGSLEFATEAYNYNTMSDDDPRNLVLLCTTQGVAVQQDGRGAKRIFHHAVDDAGKIHRYWLEAERSDHRVGGAQRESQHERDDALARGKATASVIGTQAMGTRFNVLMTIQVPLQQMPKTRAKDMLGAMGGGMFADEWMAMPMVACDGDGCSDEGFAFDFTFEDAELFGSPTMCASAPKSMASRARVPPQLGVSNAARVSRGTEVDMWSGLTVKEPKRNKTEHVTVTVVIYNTVTGGVPTVDDVAAAIDDLEALYEACGVSGKLVEKDFDFMKKELTVKDAQELVTKLTFQPPSAVVTNHDVFPS